MIGQLRKGALILATLLVVSACTSTFAYRQLDWLIPWYVDNLVDITREQKKHFKQYLEPALEWHRQEELQRYVELLDHVEADLTDPVTSAQVKSWIEEATAAIFRIESRFLEASLALGETLSEEQMAEFRQSLWEEQTEYEEEFLPRDEAAYWDEALEYLVDTTESFLGRLEKPQLAIYQESLDRLTRFDGIWLENRAAWLRRIEPLLERPPGWQDGLRQAHERRELENSVEYQRVYAANLEVLSQAVADVLNKRSDRQNEHLSEELDGWRRKLGKLIAQ